MSLALIAALPFIGALFPGLMIRAGRNACALGAGFFTALALLILAVNAPAVLRGEVLQAQIEWIPILGLNANLFLDGLGLLFAGLILGIGLLVILYARFYFSKTDPMGQFYTYLMLFQGAMVGVVLSNNILLLLVFWELTSLSSFLLIGYWKHLSEARQGARMALTVTGFGGLSMIAGMLILGNIAGSFDLSVILQNKDLIQSSPWYTIALVLILIGCFTKSAQFPFHFWLPHAMAAPTPVSSYLHSATMVKAGIFLMARLWPVMSGTPEWFYIVTTTGLVTMVFAAKVALFKDDLKGLLAYSTVSHLGLITMLLGFGTKAAAMVAVFHIINHATFKAALFMTAGIIDHEAHTRDIRRLGGLRHLMPITFMIGSVAALSMAGIPPFNGFLSKEMMLEEAAHTVLGLQWLLPVLASLGAMFSVAYSFRFIADVFLGSKRDDYSHEPHDPSFGLWAAPAFLAVLAVVIGVVPMAAVSWLVDTVGAAVTAAPVQIKIAHWHGLGSPALWMSIFAVAAGAALLWRHEGLSRLYSISTKKDGKALFTRGLSAITVSFAAFDARLHDAGLTKAIAVAVAAIVGGGAYAFVGAPFQSGGRALTPIGVVPVIGWLLLILAVVALVASHRNRLQSLLLVGVIGLIVSLGFAYFSAPDLALTQISVEVVAVVLMLLALNFLPKTTPIESGKARRWRDGVIAGAAGAAIAALSYAVMTRDFAFESIAAFHIAEAKPGGGGTNIVNVILVDFRGYDTFGELTVLGIAALVIYALTASLLYQGAANRRLLAWRLDQKRAGDRHPMMLVVATRLLLPIALMVGVFIFLRGHNLPGGGFIAGLVVSIALLIQYMASGFAWAQGRLRVDYHALIALGVLISAATGIGAWFNDMPFLTSDFGYVDPPIVEKFELATAALFDLGVFFAVLGAVMLSLSSLSRIGLRSGEDVNAEPFDFKLEEGGN